MSFIQPAAISAIAHSVDVPKLSDEAAKALAPDVEFRLREIVQEALKFAKHAKRTVVTTEDIKQALRLRNADPVYGFCSSDPARYLRVSGHPELFYVKDPDLSFTQLIDAPLPPPPRDMGLAMHWLAVGGVQPRIPENQPLPLEHHPQRKRQRPAGKDTGRMVAPRAADATTATAGRSAAAAAGGGGASSGAGAAGGAGQLGGSGAQGIPGAAHGQLVPGVRGAAEVQAPVSHLVPKELWVYFDKLVGLLTSHPAAAAAAASSITPAPAAAASGGLGGAGGSDAAGLWLGRVHWAALPDAPPAAASSLPLGIHTLPSSQGLPSLPSGAASSSRPLPGAPPPAAAGASSAARSHAAMVRAALASVGSDTGLHPLTPYFVNFIAEGVRKYSGDLEVLPRLLGLARALLCNQDLHLAPYLKQLLPAVMTALLTSPLGGSRLAPSWAVRDMAASLLAQICERFSAPYHNVQPQVCRVLLAAWQDPAKALDTKYGAVVGLAALGPAVVANLLLPSLEPQLTRTVLPALATPASSSGGPDGAAPMEEDGPAAEAKQLQQRQQQEAQQLQQAQSWQLFGALLEAVGGAVYSQVMGRVRDALPLDMLMRRGAAYKAPDWDDIERALQAQAAAEKAETAVVATRERPVQVQLCAVPPEHQHRLQGRLVVVRVRESQDVALAALKAAKEKAAEAAAKIAATRRAWHQHHQQQRGGSSSKAAAGSAAGGSGATGMDIDGPPAAAANGHAPSTSKPAGSSSSKQTAAAKLEGGPAAAAGGEAGDPGLLQLSAVLAESWKEDSDVGATLDALSHVFGERLLPYMPLFQLPSCNL